MSTQTQTPSLSDAISFIINDADGDELERILDAYKSRRKALASVRAASLSKGAEVTLVGLSPKYLNGLVGVVASIKGQRCSVTLDGPSTEKLRYAGTRFYIPTTVTNYVLTGIPTSCAEITA